jgi:hypothetical protein
MIALIWFIKTLVDKGEWSIYLVPNKICKNCLFIVCLFVLSRKSNFSAIWRLSSLPVTGLQIQTYA